MIRNIKNTKNGQQYLRNRLLPKLASGKLLQALQISIECTTYIKKRQGNAMDVVYFQDNVHSSSMLYRVRTMSKVIMKCKLCYKRVALM